MVFRCRTESSTHCRVWITGGECGPIRQHVRVSWRAISRSQGGVISRAQLRTAGVSAHVLVRMVRHGELDRLSCGVYLVGGTPLTTQGRLWATVLATDGVLGYATAGQLWNVHEADNDVHVIVPRSRRPVPAPWAVLHRQQLPRGPVRHPGELPVTSRSWTVLDLLATLPPKHAAQLADRAIQRHWLAERDCTDRLRDQPHRPGNAQLRAIADMLGDGAAADSERVLHRLLRHAGVIGWVPNHPIWADGELIGVVDVAIPSRGIAIEVDGMAYHLDVDRFRRDRSRQNTLVAHGWTVLRFTWADLTERPGYVMATVTGLAA